MSYETLISVASDIGDIDVLVSLYHQLPLAERAQFDAAVPKLAKKYGLLEANDFVTFVREVYDPYMLEQVMQNTDDLLRYLQEGEVIALSKSRNKPPFVSLISTEDVSPTGC